MVAEAKTAQAIAALAKSAAAMGVSALDVRATAASLWGALRKVALPLLGSEIDSRHMAFAGAHEHDWSDA